MIVSRLFKRLKKQLRRRKLRINLGIGVVLLLGVSLWLLLQTENVMDTKLSEDQAVFNPINLEETQTAQKLGHPSQTISEIMDVIKQKDQPLDVEVKSIYVCGEENIKLEQQRPDQIIALLEDPAVKHVNLHEEGYLQVEKHISDLSPECKANAYIGIDEAGNLTLFDGLPGQEKVIRTFFQMNIEYLESSIPRQTIEQLYKGIKVTDLAEYNSVISTFSDYAVEDSEQVMSSP